MKKQFLLVILSLFLGIGSASAQFTEVVHLKNGGEIRGIIIEQVPNQHVKIQTNDQSVFVCKMDEIDKITKEIPANYHARHGFATVQNAKFYKGQTPCYMGMVDFGYSFGVGTYGEDRMELSTTHGCLLNPYFYVGAGLGLNYYHSADLVTVPFFADLRAYPMRGDIKPFVNLRIGYSVGDLEGFYFNPSIGVSIKRVDISLGYTMQKAKVDILSMYGLDYLSINSGAISLKVGVTF